MRMMSAQYVHALLAASTDLWSQHTWAHAEVSDRSRDVCEPNGMDVGRGGGNHCVEHRKQMPHAESSRSAVTV